jgi:hypothetical protein
MKEAAKRPHPRCLPPTKPSQQGRRVIQRFGGIFLATAPRVRRGLISDSPKAGKVLLRYAVDACSIWVWTSATLLAALCLFVGQRRLPMVVSRTQ